MATNHQSPPQTADITRVLREHGISPTKQRVEVARMLLSKKQHLSAEQVLEEVNRHGGKVSKATIYNTLGLFARKGLIRELVVDPTKIFYDSNVSDHHHFYNVDTGELMDIEMSEIDVGRLPSLPPGTRAEGVDVIIKIRNE